jgi:hypothetical protein
MEENPFFPHYTTAKIPKTGRDFRANQRGSCL